MRSLRRPYAPGSYFFTVVTEHRRPLLIENIGLLRSAFRRTASRRPFTSGVADARPPGLFPE